jgi:hypothetical protein
MATVNGSPDSFKATEYATVTYESKENSDGMNDAKNGFKTSITTPKNKTYK